MANTSDLRFVKTERIIEEAYLALKRKSHAPIKVSELCKTALINKTTFYAHYETMDALHKHMCIKHVETILNGCAHVDEAFTDTAAFVHAMVQAICDNVDTTYALFGRETTKQTNVFEACLLKRYLYGDESDEKRMTIIFAIGGAARLLISDRSDDRMDMTIRLIGRLLTEDHQQAINHLVKASE